MRQRWMLLPVAIAMVLVSGCGLRSLFGGGSTTASPAEATVTAIVQASAMNIKCDDKTGTGNGTPTLDYSLVSAPENTAAPIGAFGHTTVTLIGTCWQPGHTVTIASLAKGPNGAKVITPLATDVTAAATGTATPVVTSTPLTTTINADGTFTATFPLVIDWAPYVEDTRFPFIAYSDNFLQMAATTIEVSS